MRDGISDEVAQIQRALAASEPGAANRLLPLVYDQLRGLAAGFMRRAGAGHTLQPTAVVHEAWLKIADHVAWESRAHFLAVAAKAMRQILIDHARRRSTQKRGEGLRALTLDEALVPTPARGASVDILALEHALQKLAALNPRHAQQVELRFFGGMSVPETAEVLDVSLSTAEKDWAMARAWLFRELGGEAR